MKGLLFLLLLTVAAAGDKIVSLLENVMLRPGEQLCDPTPGYTSVHCLHLSYDTTHSVCRVTLGPDRQLYVRVEKVAHADECYFKVTPDASERTLEIHVSPYWKTSAACFWCRSVQLRYLTKGYFNDASYALTSTWNQMVKLQ